MPYLADYEVYDNTATGTSHVIPVPPHEVGDILVAWLNADGNNGPGLPTSTGGGTWVNQQNTANVGGQSNRLATLVCTSENETCTSSLASAETMAGWVGCVKTSGGTLSVDTSTKRGTDGSTEPFAGTAITPAAKALLLQFLSSDGGIGPMIVPPNRNIFACDTAANSVGAALAYPRTTDAVAAQDWFSGAALDNTMAAALTLIDDGSEEHVNGYLDPTSSVVYGYNGGTGTKNGWTWDAATPHPIAAFGQRDFEQVWSFDGTSTYTDETPDASDPGTADVTITNAVGAILYAGMDVPFEHATVEISTAQATATGVWEYYNGSTWATLTVTGVLTATGAVNLRWTIPTDWATYAVSSVTKYWVRYRITGTGTQVVFSTFRCGGGITTWIAAAIAADSHQLPYANSTQVTMTQSTALALVGMSAAISPAVDWSGGVLVIHHRGQLARDYRVDICKGEQDYPPTVIKRRGGLMVVLVDSSGNYEGYVIHSKQSESNSPNDFNTSVIAINDGAIPFLLGGTLDRSAIAQVYVLGQTEFGAFISYTNNWMIVESVVVLGGGLGMNPLGYEEFIATVNDSLMYSNVLRRSGDVCQVLVPLQVGGGGGFINVAMDGKTFIWPEKYDGQTQHAYNGDDGMLSFIMYGQASDDSFAFTNCVFKAGQPQTWGFDASHSADAILDFSGSTVQGFDVVLRDTVGFSGVTFIDCPTFVQNNGAIGQCTFRDTKVSVTQIADLSNLLDCSFISSGTGHAIEIGGSAGTEQLSQLRFTGYAASDGSTGNEAIYVNIATGTVTLQVVGGDMPSIRTAGATVVIENLVDVLVTAKDAGTGLPIENARVFLETAAGGPASAGVEILNVLTDVDGIATVSYNYVSSQPVTGRVRRGTSSPLYQEAVLSGSIGATGYSQTVFMVRDE